MQLAQDQKPESHGLNLRIEHLEHVLEYTLVMRQFENHEFQNPWSN